MDDAPEKGLLMDSVTPAKPRRNTEPGRRAALATFARRRAEKARAELEAQGYTVIPPKSRP